MSFDFSEVKKNQDDSRQSARPTREVFAGHSLRPTAINGVSERSIMQQTGHKSAAMVRRYSREGSLFRENAAAKIGV